MNKLWTDSAARAALVEAGDSAARTALVGAGDTAARAALVGAWDSAARVALVGGVELYSEFWWKVPVYMPKIIFSEVGWVWVELLVKKFLHISICLGLYQQKMDIDPGTGTETNFDFSPRHRRWGTLRIWVRGKNWHWGKSRKGKYFKKSWEVKKKVKFLSSFLSSFSLPVLYFIFLYKIKINDKI